MPGIKARPNRIARRYGDVLFALASETNRLNEVTDDLNQLRGCIEAEPYEWTRVISPALPHHTQEKILKRLISALKLGPLLNHFLMVLCENHRLSQVNAILEEFLQCAQRAKGIVEGVVETPFELSGKEVESLQKSLKTQLGKNVLLYQEVKESLLGGIVLRIGSLMIDASTKTQLKKLQTVMKG